MKSKLFLTVLLLAAITTIGISQEKAVNRLAGLKEVAEKARIAEKERIANLPNNVRSLVGIKGIYVVIGELKEAAKSAGLTKEKLKTDVELKLRLAGIKVNSAEEYLASEDTVDLSVVVSTITDDGYLNMIYNVSCKTSQRVVLVRNSYIKVVVATCTV